MCGDWQRTVDGAPPRASGLYPGLLPELPLSRDSWVLEARIYFGRSLLEVRHLGAPATITVGEERGCDVFVASDGLPARRFPLLRTVDGELVLTLHRGMRGEAELDGEVMGFAQVWRSPLARVDPVLAECVRIGLPFGSRAVVHWGGLSVALRYVAPGRRVPGAPLAQIDTRFVTALVASLAVHVSAAVMLLVHPTETEALERRALIDAVITLYPPQESPSAPKPPPPIPEPPRTRPEPGPSSHHPGGPTASRAPGAPVAPVTRDRIRAQFERVVARTVDALTGESGGGGLRLGGLEVGMIRSRGQDPGGLGLPGLGVRWGEPTGAGGLGRLRSVPSLPGTCVGACRSGPPRPGPSRRAPLAAIGLDQPPELVDPLDRDVIRSVIDKNRMQIRYCYERELQRDHALEGKVSVRWVIGATGQVARVLIVDSTLDNPAVHHCIEEKILGWEFPPPAGGGKVDVNYAFVFSAHG